MSDALVGMLIAFAGSLLTLIVPVLVNRRKNQIEADRLEAELDKVDMETIIALKRQIKELVEEVKQLQDDNRQKDRRMDKLERKLIIAIEYIRTIDANNPILERLMDTQDLTKQKK